MSDDAWPIARRLYALPRAEFIAARNAEARELKAAGNDLAVTVGGFAKPSAAAELINRLVREHADLLDEIGDLGRRLRSAQRRSEASELRALDQERRTLVSRGVQAARTVAEDGGSRATDATLRDVEQTVWAAIVDASAYAVLSAGALVRPMAPGGFGTVDVTDVSAVPVEADDTEEDEAAPPPRRRPAKKATAKKPTDKPAAEPAAQKKSAARGEARAKARRELDSASSELETAEKAAHEAADLLEKVDDQTSALQRERDELRDRLATIERDLRDATRELKDRQAAHRTAERDQRTAAERVERARRRLAALDD